MAIGLTERFSMGRKLLRSAGRTLQIVLGVGLLVYLGRYIFLRWREVSDVGLTFRLPPLLASSLLLIFFYGLYSLTWQRILRWINHHEKRFSMLTLLRIFFVSFLTRYLPAGTLWNVGGRIELLKREGGKRSVGFESVLFEQMYLMGGSIFLAALSVFLFPQHDLPSFLQPYQFLLVVGGVIGCLLLLVAPDWALWLTARLMQRPELAKTSDHINIVCRVEIFIRFVLANLLQGAAAVSVLLAVYPPLVDRMALLPVFLAAYPLSRFVGQIIAFLPGGVGIREGTFVLLLGPLLPVGPLLVTAALMRLLSVVIELLMLGVILVISKVAGVESRSESGSSTPLDVP